MSAKFTYKGINIEDILDIDTNSTNTTIRSKFVGFPPTKAFVNYANSRVPNLGYSISGEDITTITNARHNKYTTNVVNMPIPAGVKKYRYFLQGGGGGGGGGGGVANSNGSAQGNGGAGGGGGVGDGIESLAGDGIPLGAYTTFSLIVGTGGPGGAGGNNSSNKDSKLLKAPDGKKGDLGIATTLTFNTTQIATAPGGNAGTGGGGGSAEWFTVKDYEAPGGPGGTDGGKANNATPNKWDTTYVVFTKGGGGGAGGQNINDPGDPGGKGDDGYATIVWLYE